MLQKVKLYTALLLKLQSSSCKKLICFLACHSVPSWLMESYRQSQLGIRLGTGSRSLLIPYSCWSSENHEKLSRSKWIWVSHAQWCLVQHCEGMFVHVCHRQKKCAYLRLSICCQDQGEARELPPHCLIFILCIMVVCLYDAAHLAGHENGNGFNSWWISLLWCCHGWDKTLRELSSWWKYFKAQKLMPHIIAGAP